MTMSNSLSRKKHGKFYVIDAFVYCLIGVISACMILSANTLYCNVGDRSWQIRLCGIVFLCSVLVVVALWATREISKVFLQRWLAYCLFVITAYVSVSLLTGHSGGTAMLFAVGNIIVFPFLLHLLIDSGGIQFALTSFVVIVLFLALTSLVLWLLGPISEIIAPNCHIMSSWGSQGRVFTSKPGWYGLLYVTQIIDSYDLPIVRNTGIFCEAPMYSYVLSAALLLERYFRERPHFINCFLLAVTIFTTLSTTGMILVLLVLAQSIYSSVDSFSPRVRTLLRLLFVVVILGIVILIYSLFAQKINSDSGLGRIDDFRAGFMAWSNNIIVGNGFGNDDVIQRYMSGFRADNLGFSNSPMQLLAEGGLLWFCIFLPPIVGFFRIGGKRAYGLICFLYLWTVTIVSFLPLTFLFFGLGSNALFSSEASFSRSKIDSNLRMIRMSK